MKNNLQRIFEKYSFPERDIKSEIEVIAVESYSKLKLPKDYLFYLENYFGIDQFIGVEFIKLWSLEEVIHSNENYNIVQQLNRTLGIGTNGSGEFIGIEMDQNENLRIILSPFVDLNSKNSIEIGKSFTDFLVRLDNGVDWFA